MRWGIILLFLINLINVSNAQVTCEKYKSADDRSAYRIFENGQQVFFNSDKHAKYFDEVCNAKLIEVKQADVKPTSSCPWYNGGACNSTAGFKRLMSSQNLRSNYVSALVSAEPKTLEDLLQIQIPKIDDNCPVNNYCSENNTCQPKICLGGSELIDGYCVINILNDENPCLDVAPNTVPYLIQMTNEATPETPKDFAGRLCLTPNNLRNYPYYPLSYSQGTGRGLNPTFSFVGCKYEEGRSKALYKLSAGPVSNPIIDRTSYPLKIAMYCADGNVASSDNDKFVAQIYSFSGVQDDGYIALNASNYCYRYKPLLIDGYSKVDLAELSVPYVSCEDCGLGLIKINGECTCPSDMDKVNGTCKRKIKCETLDDFYNGLCTCGGNPYRVAGSVFPIEQQLGADDVYTCNQPQYSRSPEVSNGGLVNGSVSSLGCVVENNKPIFKYSVTVSGSITTPINVRCIDLDFRERDQNYYYDWGAAYAAGSALGTLQAGQSATFSYSIIPDGTCYKYKFYALDGYSYQWEQDVTITYPFCK